MSENNKTRRSWKLFSLETLLGLVAVGLLVGGAMTGTVLGIFWGILVLAGLVALHLIRQKDWEKHWQEHEKRRNR